MDMRGCAATPRRPSGHRQKQNGYRASQRRREMATKPSPSWPPFPIPNFGLIVKLRGNRSFLSSKTFNDRLFPPPPSPSSPLLSSPRWKLNRTSGSLPPLRTFLSLEKNFSKRNYASLRGVPRQKRIGVFFFSFLSFFRTCKSLRRDEAYEDPILESGRILSLLSPSPPVQLRVRRVEDEGGWKATSRRTVGRYEHGNDR